MERIFLNDRKKKKLSQSGRNVRKYRLVDIATASFNTIMGQMTEMSQRKKSVPSMLISTTY